MDINYWIFILIAYLIAQWVKRRARRFEPQAPEAEPDTPAEGEEMPEWLRSLGLSELLEKADLKEEVEELYEELEGEVTEDGELGVIVEEPTPPPQAPTGIGEGPHTEPIWERQRSRAHAPGHRRQVAHPIHHFLRSPEGLGNVILLREILGPPRALQRHRFRAFF